MIDYKKELNDAQYKVVTEGDGPALVLAGAGSGKTRTLVYRVAYLIDQGVKPERILLLTFTNKAANEMLDRVHELIGSKNYSGKIWGGTFHHVANRLLRKMGGALDLKNNFTILDRDDSSALLKRIIKQQQKSTRRLPKPGIFLDVISFASNAQIHIEDSLAAKYPDGMDIANTFKAVAAEYERRKREGHLLDFDDLLLYWLRLLKNPAIKKKLATYWDYVLVDEYQDTNVVQDAIVRALASEHNNLLVVGDDAQSIYSFRAADIENILSFPKRLKDTKTYKLERNYRSSPEILDVANAIIKLNQDQFKKTLYTEEEGYIKPQLIIAQDPDDEACQIADRIIALEDEGERLSNIAVLFRAAHNSQPLELELNKRRIPYEMRGGVRFFDRAHIKDSIAYLRILSNVQDEASWYRVLNLYEGIGEVTAQNIINEVKSADVKLLDSISMRLSSAAERGWQQVKKGIAPLTALVEEAPGTIIRALLPHYKQYAELQYLDFRDRLEDLEQLSIFADRYESLDSFLSEITLQEAFVVRAGTEVNSEDGVILSTIHQAKGLEWNTVFVASLTNMSLPHPRAMQEEGGLEEERRLFYVATTRARRRLYLTYPISGSRHSLGLHQPSQFLKEIDANLLSGDVELDPDEQYIDVDDDGGRSFLPSVEDL